ncbi:transmembrane and coiled-coil domains protein 2 isoform X1 [Drosophila albomicans]|uniref:Transmembrane and coiled-coil domains protein 2 isoform X1 n=1 Tax=Drosophila albomicans TaxID=7291 RepID=A0A6P8Z6S4_DROAB|nr:transmembrane and coiled-coil domains protein 2 isoform X1 [Drosophila albomicans]XP_034112258.1 transmembrane and coiled-coil domains protein 2 isoform X1 [Drosophila albomicans]
MDSLTTLTSGQSTCRDHLSLQPLQKLRSSRGSSSNLRTSRSPSASRSSEQMSRERSSDSTTAAAASSAVAATAAAVTGNVATTTSSASAAAATTTATGTGTTSATSTTANSNSSASSSTVAAAQAAVYSGGNTVTGSLGSSGGVAVRGFRSHSPTHRRRSRERQRRTHGSDQGGLLAYSGLIGEGSSFIAAVRGGGDGGGGGGGSAGTGSGLEDSRLSGNEDYYSSFVSDEFDSSKKLHHRRTHERSSSVQAIDRLNTKIQCTKESIRQEQTARDDNVNEYLKLAASADKQQLQRIKAVFEKKNQKSAHSISQLQKKLDNYTKRAKDLQNHQYQTKSQHRQPREVLRDVGQGLRNVGGNIRDGITGFSGSVMSKPREFAHLIKNKFGSADNINQMSEAELQGIQSGDADVLNVGNNERLPQLPGMGTSTGSGGGNNNNNTGTGSGTGKFNSDNGSECSSVTSESIPAGSGKSQSGASQYHIVLKSLLTELAERKAENDKLKERIERLETGQKEFNNLTSTLESERYRAEGLEEQINDLTELHQNEIENLKQTIADMEEKVQYQSDERLRDVNEVLENCQTRISKMEHMSQQQYVTVEGIDNSNARALVVKLINVVLTILQVVLLLVATAAGIIMPFLKTRVRVLTTFLTICIIIFVIRQWPDVQDIGAGLVRHLKQSLVVK